MRTNAARSASPRLDGVNGCTSTRVAMWAQRAHQSPPANHRRPMCSNQGIADRRAGRRVSTREMPLRHCRVSPSRHTQSAPPLRTASAKRTLAARARFPRAIPMPFATRPHRRGSAVGNIMTAFAQSSINSADGDQAPNDRRLPTCLSTAQLRSKPKCSTVAPCRTDHARHGHHRDNHASFDD